MSGTSAYAPRNDWAQAGSAPRRAGRLAEVRLLDLLVELPRQRAGRLVGVRLLDLLVELPRQRAGRLVGVRQVHGR